MMKRICLLATLMTSTLAQAATMSAYFEGVSMAVTSENRSMLQRAEKRLLRSLTEVFNCQAGAVEGRIKYDGYFQDAYEIRVEATCDEYGHMEISKKFSTVYLRGVRFDGSEDEDDVYVMLR